MGKKFERKLVEKLHLGFNDEIVDKYLSETYRIDPDNITTPDKIRIIGELDNEDLKFDGYYEMLVTTQDKKMENYCEESIEKITKEKLKQTRIKNYIQYLAEVDINKAMNYYCRLIDVAKITQAFISIYKSEALSNDLICKDKLVKEIIDKIETVENLDDRIKQYASIIMNCNIDTIRDKLVENIMKYQGKNKAKIIESYQAYISDEDMALLIENLNEDEIDKLELNKIEKELYIITAKNIDIIIKKIRKLFYNKTANDKNRIIAKRILLELLVGIIKYKHPNIEEIAEYKINEKELESYLSSLDKAQNIVKICNECYDTNKENIKTIYLSLRCPMCGKQLDNLQDFKIGYLDERIENCIWCGAQLDKNSVPILGCKECIK